MRTTLALASLVLLLGPRAAAYETYLNVFSSTYPSASRLNTCLTCHQGSDPNQGPPQSNRNSYGSTFSGQPHSLGDSNSIRTALKNIEGVDSDGDGASNGFEISSNTFPGNGSDTPVTTGSLTVTISPAGAVSAGAQWQVDGGSMHSSGETVSNLSAGSHTVHFGSVSQWSAPSDQQVTITAGSTTSASGTYTLLPGSLQVTIVPAEAANAGAQWQVDGGSFHSSGETVNGLTPGSHTVHFNSISQWNSPPDQQVQITAGSTAGLTGTYGLLPGSVQVTISPDAAVNAGAQWQLDGGAFHNSGETVSGLSAGSHSIHFNSISQWTSPGDQQIQVLPGSAVTASGTYTLQPGSLQVTIAPAEAVSAGAQWQVDGGTFHNSGETVSGLTPGSHTIHFNTLSQWVAPSDQQVEVVAGSTATATGAYSLQTGGLQVSILPSEAAAAGAQWQVDGGAFHNSGETVTGLSAGTHTIHFNSISQWTSPTDQQVPVVAGSTVSATGTYTLLPGSLQVTIVPAGAASAGAQWQLDGGAFHNSGETVTGLAPGPHTVHFNTISQWNSPSDQQVTVTAGSTATASGTYTLQTGGVQVSILPAGAAAAGAQWQVDGGAFHNSGETVTGLSAGAHAVHFNSISQWTSPTDQQVEIIPGSTVGLTGTYVLMPGSLQVTIVPAAAVSAGAQWQVDGGAFHSSGETVSGLTPGSHTIHFSTINQWFAASDQQVEVIAGSTATATGTYSLQTGGLQVSILPSDAAAAGAQWQVDGGAFHNSGETVTGLSAGTHTVHFNSISQWTSPSNQEVQLVAGSTVTATGTYTPLPGALQVTITPLGAINAGAQWQVDGGALHASGETATGLGVGTHTVHFKAIEQWTAPPDQQVTVSSGTTTTISGAYSPIAGSGLSVAIVTPASNTRYEVAQTIPLQANAGANSGVAKVEFYDNGTLAGTATSAPYVYDWTFTSLENGSHAWTAKAYDRAGGALLSAPVTLTVAIDDLLPSVTIVEPTNGTRVTTAQDLTISAAASDNVGVTKLEFYEDDQLRATLSQPPHNYLWTVTAADNGSHIWKAKAFDAAGNSVFSAPVTVVVDIVSILPRLAINHDFRTFTIRWSSGDAALVLEQNDVLDGSHPWVPVSTTPTVSGDSKSVTLPLPITGLRAAWQNGQLQLEWPQEARVERAASLRGPWADLETSLSPQSVSPLGPSGFFRLASQLRTNLDGGRLTLTWPAGSKLQRSLSAHGPWTDIPGAASPWSVELSNPPVFYRIQSISAPPTRLFYRLHRR